MPQGLTYEQVVALGGKPVATKPQGGGLTYEQVVALGGKPVEPKPPPGGLRKLFDFPTKGLVSKDFIVRAISGRTPTQLEEELSSFSGESPRHAAIREFVRGTIQSLGEVGSGFTSPVAIGTMGAGAASRIPGAVGTLARTASGTAGAGFGLKGAQQAIEAEPTSGKPEEIQKFLAGLGMTAGGATGLLASGQPKFATQPVETSAKEFIALGKGIAKGTFALPSTVEYSWAKGALELLKKARQQDHSTKTAAYPKIKPSFQEAEVATILPKEHPLAGIRAAREKLDAAGLTEEGIRNARAELWTYRRRMGLPSDEFKAYKDAYEQLTGQLRGQYQQAGKLKEFLDAEKGFAQHMETFYGKQSPIAKALQSELPASGFVEPSTVFRKFGTTVAEKQIESLGGLGLGPGELFRMQQVKKFSDPAFSSGIAFTLKIPLIRQALEYLITRPVGINALQKVNRASSNPARGQ